MTRRHRKIMSGLVATAVLAPLTIGALASAAPGGNAPRPHQRTICHATASATNPYVLIHPATAGVMHGHLGEHHQGARDIIPPFVHRGETHEQNWDAEGMATHANGCGVPGVTPPELSPPDDGDPPPPAPPVADPPVVDPPEDEPEAPGEPLPDEPTTGTFGF